MRTCITNPIYPTAVSCYPFDEPEEQRGATEITATETERTFIGDFLII